MKKWLLKGADLIDPKSGVHGATDLLIEDGFVKEIGSGISTDQGTVIDVSGKTIFPSFCDLHVHLREPGQTHKETIKSGGAAAAKGGVGALLSMPNTDPPIDSVERFLWVCEKAKQDSLVDIYQAASITCGMQGEVLVDMEALMEAGVRAFSEDGKSVLRADLLKEAMRLAKAHDVPICEHCEEPSLVAGGVIHDGEAARRLGLAGIPGSAEDVITARDCVLALETDAQLHICHCSTKGSVEIIRAAKKLGGRITAEACPHHFSLCDEDIPADDGIYKVNPPLRSRADKEAIREALADGTIDCISTDHAPHAMTEKEGGFIKSAFGMSGIEISAALTYTNLVKTGVLSLSQMAERMSLAPTSVLHVPGGTLGVGAPANLVVMDLTKRYTIAASQFSSMGKNTPFDGLEVYGQVLATMKNGTFIYGEYE